MVVSIGTEDSPKACQLTHPETVDKNLWEQGFSDTILGGSGR